MSCSWLFLGGMLSSEARLRFTNWRTACDTRLLPVEKFSANGKQCLIHLSQPRGPVQTAIVTGASQGIGAGLVEAFLKRGYNVVANSRQITKASPLAASTNLALVDGNIGDPSTATKIVDSAVSKFGRIDVLINNAGVFISKPFTEYTTEDFNSLVSTTLGGFLYLSQLAVKQMLKQKSGNIINVSTTLVDQPIAGVGAAVQIMLKGGLNAVTRALAIEYAKEGIRVNTISAGVINTPMHKPEAHEFLKGLQPVGRIGEVNEVVDAALFLTDATFTSGEVRARRWRRARGQMVTRNGCQS